MGASGLDCRHMQKPTVELEIRGEIKPTEITILRQRLKKLGFKATTTTRRTSVMSFGTASASGLGWNHKKKDEVDVRCRMTNGQAEVVTKIGRTSAANRIEVSVPVSKEDLLRFARLFGAMPLFTKVGSRVTENFEKDDVTVSLVSSIPSLLSYIEIERMTTREKEAGDLKILQAIAKDLYVTLWRTHKQFIDFCARLTKEDDWEFAGTDADLKRLEQDIRTTKSHLARGTSR